MQERKQSSNTLFLPLRVEMSVTKHNRSPSALLKENGSYLGKTKFHISPRITIGYIKVCE